MFLIYGVIMALLSYVPILGPLASGLLGTILAGGLIYGVSQLDGGGKLEIMHLFQAFTDSAKTGPMLILGVIALVANLLIAIVGKGLIGSAFSGAGMMGGGPAIQLGGTVLLGLLLVLMMAAALAAMLAYAIPLVMLQSVEPFDAIRLSVMGGIRNWLPLLVLGLICTVLSLIAMIPMGLGLLILGPVMATAWYLSYKELYI
jgi:uncharacterized membrane protein